MTQAIHSKHAKRRKYTIAAHYFGSQWPLTFWSSFVRAEVERDFARIFDDGFNTIILVMPTRMFVDASTAQSAFYVDRLKFLLKSAREAGLDVILRIGYPHDVSPANCQIIPRLSAQHCFLLHQVDDVYGALMQHAKFVSDLVASEPHVKFVFISWEDMWCVFKTFPTMDPVKRKRLAKQLEFPRWAEDNVPADLRAYFGIDLNNLSIPEHSSPLFVLYKQFYDGYVFRRFIDPLSKIFRNFAYEQRSRCAAHHLLGWAGAVGPFRHLWRRWRRGLHVLGAVHGTGERRRGDFR